MILCRFAYKLKAEMLRKFYFTIEDKGGRSRHIDVVVALAPFNVKRATIHHDTALPTRSLCEAGCYSRGTGTCATGHRDTATPFPDAGADTAVGLDACKLDVATLGKGRVKLKDAPSLAHLVDVIRKDDVVGVPH